MWAARQRFRSMPWKEHIGCAESCRWTHREETLVNGYPAHLMVQQNSKVLRSGPCYVSVLAQKKEHAFSFFSLADLTIPFSEVSMISQTTHQRFFNDTYGCHVKNCCETHQLHLQHWHKPPWSQSAWGRIARCHPAYGQFLGRTLWQSALQRRFFLTSHDILIVFDNSVVTGYSTGLHFCNNTFKHSNFMTCHVQNIGGTPRWIAGGRLHFWTKVRSDFESSTKCESTITFTYLHQVLQWPEFFFVLKLLPQTGWKDF